MAKSFFKRLLLRVKRLFTRNTQSTNPVIETPKIFEPVGRCIYCGANGERVKLTDEHVIPFALGGNLILPQASCKKCAKVINETIERKCLRRMFGPLRLRLNYPTRRPKERPKTLPVLLEIDGKVEKQEVQVADRPHVTIMFAFELPGIIKGLSPEESAKIEFPATWVNTADFDFVRKSARKINKLAKRISVGGEFHPGTFSKMLAKIGHAFAVAELGIDGFTPWLPDAIIGKTELQPGYLIGGLPDQLPASEYAYEIQLGSKEMPNNRKLVIVRIRLFADLGAPEYVVVAGDRP